MHKYKIVFKSGETVVVETGTYSLSVSFDAQTHKPMLTAYESFCCDFSLVLYYTKVN